LLAFLPNTNMCIISNSNTNLKAANPIMRSHENWRLILQMNQCLLNSRDAGHCRGMLHGAPYPWTYGLQSAVTATPAL
jgi:hypothetical protein